MRGVTVARLYHRRPTTHEVMRWGPSYAEMQSAVEWLDSFGARYAFRSAEGKQASFADFKAQDAKLPDLVVYDFRYRPTVCSIGDYLVREANNDVTVEHVETLDGRFQTLLF